MGANIQSLTSNGSVTVKVRQRGETSAAEGVDQTLSIIHVDKATCCFYREIDEMVSQGFPWRSLVNSSRDTWPRYSTDFHLLMGCIFTMSELLYWFSPSCGFHFHHVRIILLIFTFLWVPFSPCPNYSADFHLLVGSIFRMCVRPNFLNVYFFTICTFLLDATRTVRRILMQVVRSIAQLIWLL